MPCKNSELAIRLVNKWVDGFEDYTIPEPVVQHWQAAVSRRMSDRGVASKYAPTDVVLLVSE